jgi:uncharacterized protein (TIGR04255 family)
MPSAIRHLVNPPIVEALVEIRGTWGVREVLPSTFESIKAELSADYPESETRLKLEARIEVASSQVEIQRPSEFHGVFLKAPSSNRLVQLRVDGFAFSQLKPYRTGEALLEEALAIWKMYAEVVRPTAVTRIALRYINRLSLPFTHGDQFSRFLTAAPSSPEGAPQSVSEFFSRVVTHPWPAETPVAPDGDETVAIITQKLAREGVSTMVTLDIDAFKVGPSLVHSIDGLRTELETLRKLKNEIFFALLTEEALRLCDR